MGVNPYMIGTIMPHGGLGMFTIREERCLKVPGQDVWEVLDDFGAHHQFNPFIEESRITNGVPVGEGAERLISLYDGAQMRQRIIDYQPPRSMVIEVVESSEAIRHHLVEISVAPQTAETCVLAYTVSFKAPFGALGYALGLYQKLVLRSRYALVLRGLERYVASLDDVSSVDRR